MRALERVRKYASRVGAKYPYVYAPLAKCKRGPVILAYHGVEADLRQRQLQPLHMSASDFERHVQYLARHFEVVSLEHVFAALKSGERLDPRHVVITFDDGYENNASVVAPLLTAYNMPFSVFVTTRHIDEQTLLPHTRVRAALLRTRQSFAVIPSVNQSFDLRSEGLRVQAVDIVHRLFKVLPWQRVEQVANDLDDLLPSSEWAELRETLTAERFMTWDQVRELRQMGVTIGPHGHDHTALTDQHDVGELDRQLRVSKALIEAHVGSCSFIAYPHGAVTGRTVRRALAFGYELGLSTHQGEVRHGHNMMLLPRIVPDDHVDSLTRRIHLAFAHTQRHATWTRESVS